MGGCWRRRAQLRQPPPLPTEGALSSADESRRTVSATRATRLSDVRRVRRRTSTRHGERLEMSARSVAPLPRKTCRRSSAACRRANRPIPGEISRSLAPRRCGNSAPRWLRAASPCGWRSRRSATGRRKHVDVAPSSAGTDSPVPLNGTWSCRERPRLHRGWCCRRPTSHSSACPDRASDEHHGTCGARRNSGARQPRQQVAESCCSAPD